MVARMLARTEIKRHLDVGCIDDSAAATSNRGCRYEQKAPDQPHSSDTFRPARTRNES
jgi:hypothetical protein